jgi:hypothetical protein
MWVKEGHDRIYKLLVNINIILLNLNIMKINGNYSDLWRAIIRP